MNLLIRLKFKDPFETFLKSLMNRRWRRRQGRAGRRGQGEKLQDAGV
jgi:hypothetical protein